MLVENIKNWKTKLAREIYENCEIQGEKRKEEL